MTIEKDGHLCLHVCDLFPERIQKELPDLDDFKPDVWIAAAYANLAGYRVYFVRPGQKAVRIQGNHFFVEKRVK